MAIIDALIVRIDNLIRSRLDAAITSRLASSDSRINNLDATVGSRLASADSRLNNLDTTVGSRLASADSRLNNLNTTVGSRLASNDSRLNNLDATVGSRAADKGQRPKSAKGITTNTEVILMNAVAGPGHLKSILWSSFESEVGLKSLKVTIDGGAEEQILDNSTLNYSGIEVSGAYYSMGRIDLNVRFKTSCTVKATGNFSVNTYCNCIYSLDI